MRRVVLSLIIVSLACAGLYVSTSVNAAELFNTGKTSSPSLNDDTQLFNGSKGLKKTQRSSDKKIVKGSGLKMQSRTSLSAYRGQDLFSMLEQRISQMNSIAKIVMDSNVNTKGAQKRGWGPQAFSFEDQKKIYARNVYVEKNLAELHLKEMAALDQEFVEDQAAKEKNWEQEKRARRLAKFGKQVGKVFGGYDFPKTLEADAEVSSKGGNAYSDLNQILKNGKQDEGSATSSGEEKVVRKTKALTTPRLFNNVQ